MTIPRAQHTATLLNDGTVLIAGGYTTGNRIVGSAELYDPATGTFHRVGDMSDARRGHTATLLRDGTVLIAGGFNDQSSLSSVDIYDPATQSFTPAGPLLEGQGCHGAALLDDGTVLIAGGEISTFAEVFDPATRTFRRAAAYPGDLTCPTATLLSDGRVLLIADNPAQIYDPVANRFSSTGTMPDSAYCCGIESHAVTALRDGTVLMTGGTNEEVCWGFMTAEIFDPPSNTFRAAGSMTDARDWHTSTTLEDGSVLIAGGGNGGCDHTRNTAEVYDPVKHTFTAVGPMSHDRSTHSATLLRDGTVLIAGGDSWSSPGGSFTASAELYRPLSQSGRRRAVRP